MNENVNTKTPKTRRWVARLLVSALCILLASSLLFVGVVAENIELVVQFTGNYGLATAPYKEYVYPFGSDFLVYSNSYLVYLQKGSSVKSVFDIRSSDGYNSAYLSDNFSFYYDGILLYALTTRKTSTDILVSFFTFSIVDDEIVSASVVNASTYLSGSHYSPFAPFVVVDGNVYSFYLWYYNGSSTITYLAFLKLSGSNLSYFYSDNLGSGYIPHYSSVSFQNGYCILGLYKKSKCYLFNIFSNSFSSLTPPSASTTGQNYIFDYEDDTYYVNSDVLCKWNIDTVSFERVGSGVSGYYFSSNNGVLNSYSLPSSMSISYTVYTGLPTTEPPPESSDETTEAPPPESSEESSEEPAGGGTKIWGSILNADGSYTSSLLGTLDLSQATEVRAYIGSWTSQGSPFQSETPVPLTFYVYNGEEGPPDIYTFDYHAAGYSLSGDSASDFSFPDLIGQFFTLPYNGETDLYFANVAPYGTVLVSTPFGDSFGGRVMLNLVSVDSYFRLDFVDEDTFTVVVYNEDPVGSRISFEMDIRAYREGYRSEDGETSSSRWFYPSFGSSASYTAEYVTENGLYLVFVDSVNDTVYPWEDGTWSDIIGDANSRLEDISVDHALLESLANDAYGQYSFDPMTNQNFVGAVSEFNDIRNSSGGDYILRYMWGMWNIHPFASSMIAIVGTLAIVGFIIRKM